VSRKTRSHIFYWAAVAAALVLEGVMACSRGYRGWDIIEKVFSRFVGILFVTAVVLGIVWVYNKVRKQ